MDSSSDESISPVNTNRRRTRSKASVSGVKKDTNQRTVKTTIKAKKPASSVVTKKKMVNDSAVSKPATITRKAPTGIAEQKVVAERRKKQLLVVGYFLIGGIVTSAGVGYLDHGQIDVQGTIEARNERIRTNTADERDVIVSHIEVPVQNSSATKRPDGGLIGYAAGNVPKPPPSVVATTSPDQSTTTESVATSTEQTSSSSEGSLEDSLDTEETDVLEGGVE